MNNEPSAEPVPADDATRSRFERERRRSTRTSVIAGGLVGAVGMPVWSLFDHLVTPENAWEFTVIRLIATAVIATSLALAFTSFGRRHPEPLGLAIVGVVEIAIAAMIVQLDDHLAAYALGMSLPIYACGFLLVWPPRYTLAVLGIAGLSLTGGWLIGHEPVSTSAVATVSFYVLTAGAIAVAGQIVRDRAAWREFRTKVELEAEQRRSGELVDKLDKLSHEDPLTGLANRRAWDDAIARAGAALHRAGGDRTLSVLICDIDQLKEINDTLGHPMGDVVLRSVAELLRARIRASDMVARIGGDEFAVLAGESNEVEAATLAEDLRRRVEAEQVGGPSAAEVTVSIGVAGWDGQSDTPETLMMRADRRLYAAKAKRNVVCAGDPIEPAAE